MSHNVKRSPCQVKVNTLPKEHLGQWLSEEFRSDFYFKPAIDSEDIQLFACPVLRVLDAKTGAELFRFQTQITFQFSGAASSVYLQELVYNLLCISVDEFNSALQATGSLLAQGRAMTKPTREEIDPLILDSLQDRKRAQSFGIIPHWKKEWDAHLADNDTIIASLPPLPDCKLFAQDTTKERDASARCLSAEEPTEEDLQVLQEATLFYNACFPELERIDLGKLTTAQATELKKYLNGVFSCTPTLFLECPIKEVYRAVVVRDEFREHGKVADQTFLRYPPIKSIQEKGGYNRCSSCDLNLFYGSDQPNVPFREIKPSVGERVILSKWLNFSAKPLRYRTLCFTPGILNRFTDDATYKFEQSFGKMHPTLSSWAQTILSFISRQFIKEFNHRHDLQAEYYYSAFFGDRELQPSPPGINGSDSECIIYPSVAWDHVPINIAIHPDIVDKRFVLTEAKEYEILDTWYDKSIGLDDYPLSLKLIRTSKKIDMGRIAWDDD
ncbi:MAG TPA: hypothetical protein VNW04_12455 [Puia sp.]|jgi:hypothetical protein|nr:hypothetical protein [Puia sp.]